MPMNHLSKEDRIKLKRAELDKLKAELKKSRGSFRRSVLYDEIKALAKELAKLSDA